MAGGNELEIFRRVFFSSPDYIAFSRLDDGTYIDVNPGFERMMGYPREQVLGRTSFEVGIWPQEEDDQRIAYVAQLRREGRVTNYPGRLRRADGTVIDVEASANIIEVDGEQILIAIVRDVTERRRAERELREREAALRQLSETLEQRVALRTAQLQISEARVRSIFETSFQFMGMLSTEGLVLDANRRALEAIEVRLEDVVGRPLWETPWFAHTPGLPGLVREAVARVAAGANFRQEVCINLPAGRRIFDFSMRPVRAADGKVVGIVPEAAELTARRQVEEDLRQAQKMEAVGQLTGGLAHDFNNMLAGMAGNLQLMRMRLQMGNVDTLTQYIDAAEDIVERAASLTHRLLAFSRRQTLAPKVVNVNQLVHSMTGLIRHTVGPAVQVETQLAADAWCALCDAHQLESALLNLAINARDAMPSGGRLTLATNNAIIPDEHGARKEEEQSGRYVTIRVCDTGIGMTSEVASRAFDPFFTTKPLGQGTGLGLSMVFGFIKQSGGFVRIDTAPEAGTTISLYLPMHEGTAIEVPSPVRSLATARQQRSSGSVLLLDDETALRSVLAEALQEAGYTVLQAKDGPSALALLQDAREINLLITDFGLPGGMNGQQVMENARALRPALPMMLITGYAQNTADDTSTQTTPLEIMTKPFSLATFLARVAALLERQHTTL
jgi:PAS domain S-box-containing protein